MHVHKARNIIFLKVSAKKIQKAEIVRYCVANYVTRKHWKFEAVTNMATVSPVFWGVQSRSLLEVYRRVVVT